MLALMLFDTASQFASPGPALPANAGYPPWGEDDERRNQITMRRSRLVFTKCSSPGVRRANRTPRRERVKQRESTEAPISYIIC
jgi:hypothetical protein